MSEDQMPDWARKVNESLANIRGLWDEVAKLSDWIWHVEAQNDRIEHRLTYIEDMYRNLRRDLED